MGVKVSPDFRFALGTDQAAAPSLQNKLQRRATTVAFAKHRDGNCVCAADWLSVESDARAIRVRQRHPRVLSRVGSTWSVRKVVAVCSGRVRRVEGNRLGVAEFGRGDDQGATGWGKKPGETRPIVASWASSGPCWRRGEACPSGSLSPAPMYMIRSWLLKRFKTFPCGVPSRQRQRSNISVRTRVTMRNPCVAQHVVESTLFTFPKRVKAPWFLNAGAVGRAAGSWNERTRGPTGRAAC